MSFTVLNHENNIIELFKKMEYTHIRGSDMVYDHKSPLHDDVLWNSLLALNPNLPVDGIKDAVYKLKDFPNGSLAQKNEIFMDYLQNGIEVRYCNNGFEENGRVYIIEYNNVRKNTFQIIDQWRFVENSKKRPGIILYVNGLPLVVIELRSPSREENDTNDAYRQLKSYMCEIPSLFFYNVACVMSDHLISKVGTITSNENRFMEWKTKDGSYKKTQNAQYDTFFVGLFGKERFLDIIKNFCCFSNDGKEKVKILPGYHQYFAVKKAIESTKKAAVTDRRGGVFWHTQGSGKSLSMVFYAKMLQKAVRNPTVVVLTDRNDLDNQLYSQFSKCEIFLRQTPEQAKNRVHLRELLIRRQANGILFTTMQKFAESCDPLSERKNIIVISDEAHRAQYGLKEKIDASGRVRIGMARIIRNSLPNATYISFTGTPISAKDRSTREVFGDYIDIYDMTQSVEDGATRPVYYESRVKYLHLDSKILKSIDHVYNDIAQLDADNTLEHSKKELVQIDTFLGSEKTINSLVTDIIDHYENYRENILTGKAMIVSYSRPIAIKIYARILQIRPDWKDKIEVVMTSGNNDPAEWRKIIGNKKDKKDLERKFKDNDDPMKIAIVVDMWLTGFDVPSLATMYIYKPMLGHNLMQAIARVNRVFRDKEGGLVVDYIEMSAALKQAMNDYTNRDKNKFADTDIKNYAFPRFLEKYALCDQIFPRVDYLEFMSGTDVNRAREITSAVNFIVDPQNIHKKKIFIKEALYLKQSLSLCSSIVEPEKRLVASFYEAVRILVVKLSHTDTDGVPFSLKEINLTIHALLKKSIKTIEVVNLFSDIQEETTFFDLIFLEQISRMPQKNVAVELLKKFILEQISLYRKINLVKSEIFSERISEIMNSYFVGILSNEQVIAELLNTVKEMMQLNEESNNLGLTLEEHAFYDVLIKPNLVENLEPLVAMSQELTEILRKNRTVDWQHKESARASMRKTIKRLLNKYDYPLHGRDVALFTILRQCELWVDN